MNTYKITISNEEAKHLPEIFVFRCEAEDIATLADNLEKTASYSDELEITLNNGEHVVISQNSEHGYNADAYKDAKAYVDGEGTIGGGLCTGTFCDALEMAISNR